MALSARSGGPIIANELPRGANAADAAANDSQPATTRLPHNNAFAGAGQQRFGCLRSIVIEMLDADARPFDRLRDRHQLIDFSTNADAAESWLSIERQRKQRPDA